MPSLDDGFYARKGMEMLERGAFFTVTWNGHPTFQNPPLPFWILAQSFRLFGPNDLAARLPSILMALGILAMTYRVGARFFGRDAGLLAAALLVLAPSFGQNARRCMLEIPFAFWTTAAFLIYLEGLRRPRLHWFIAFPLAAALLTKSVLALLVVPAFAVAALASPTGEKPSARLWVGIALGILLGASWTIHQGITQGPEALRAHYLGEVLGRSLKPKSAGTLVIAYARILLTFQQPVILPALCGSFLLLREGRRKRSLSGAVVLAWAWVPFLLAHFSTVRTQRYVFWLLVPFALAAANWLHLRFPRVAGMLGRRIAPGFALLVAALIWATPALLTRDANAVFKRNPAKFQATVAPGETIPYFGNRYWSIANPLLYYTNRALAPSASTAGEAVAQARLTSSRSLVCDAENLPEIQSAADSTGAILRGGKWVWLRLPEAGGRAPRPSPRD